MSGPAVFIWARKNLVLGIVLAACAAFMFIDVVAPPIVLSDESRVAVNALEMRLRGDPLITTYDFAPDLWNTKPPLLIWLIQIPLAIFGPAEWALRAPSNLAAMGTLALVFAFTRRITRSVAAGAAAAALLALSLGFFGEHGARTADYDALLCFFTTAYLMALFFALHRRRPAPARALLIGALVAGAVLTKSIAGLTPGVGVAIYLVMANRWRRPLQSPWWAAAAIAAVLAPALYFGLREAAAPGYLAAVWRNDLGGRFQVAQEGHSGPPWFYLHTILIAPLFSAGLLALAGPFALIEARGLARQGVLYALAISAGVLIPISLASTKLAQYALPAYPFIATATAVAAHQVWIATKNRGQLGRALRITLCLVAGLIAVRAAWLRYDYLPSRQFYPQALYGRVLDGLAQQGLRKVVVVDRGVWTVSANYAPQLRYYLLAWAEDGRRARQVPTIPAPSGEAVVIASCDAESIIALGRLGANLSGVPGCIAIRRAGTPAD